MHLKVLKFHCLNICYYTFRTIEKKLKRIRLIFQKGYHIIVVTLDFTHELSLRAYHSALKLKQKCNFKCVFLVVVLLCCTITHLFYEFFS